MSITIPVLCKVLGFRGGRGWRLSGEGVELMGKCSKH
jgi:hypothetical protein